MAFLNETRRALAALGVALLLSACGGGAPGQALPSLSKIERSTSSSPIQHVVLLIQENRTFNDFFATFPGTDGTTTGTIEAYGPCKVGKTHTIPLKESNLSIYPQDLDHKYQGYLAAYDGGNMDGFDEVKFVTRQIPECKFPYQYTNPAQIQPYWQMAQQYALAEHMFTTQGSSSFVAHQDLIRGSSQISGSTSNGTAMVNDPSGIPWGCDAPAGTRTSLITYNNQYEGGAGPLPCTKDFPSSYNYNSLRDLLDAKYVTWKYYTPPVNNIFGKLMTAFDVIAAVRYGPEWKTNISRPQTNIFKDINNGSLPAMSWVIPDENASDHPGIKKDVGPAWVSSVVNAIGQSSYWGSTAIIVVWDDWGGLYDNLPPKQLGYGGLGFRVPMLVISPYAKVGYISTTDYEFGSILKYVEDNWNLGSLGTTDQRATSIIDCFDYSQKPRTFKLIKSSYGESYFLHLRPSYLPVDTDM